MSITCSIQRAGGLPFANGVMCSTAIVAGLAGHRGTTTKCILPMVLILAPSLMAIVCTVIPNEMIVGHQARLSHRHFQALIPNQLHQAEPCYCHGHMTWTSLGMPN